MGFLKLKTKTKTNKQTILKVRIINMLLFVRKPDFIGFQRICKDSLWLSIPRIVDTTMTTNPVLSISFFYGSGVYWYLSIFWQLQPSFNPLSAERALRALIDFTLSNARRFYSSMGNPLDGKGLKRALSLFAKLLYHKDTDIQFNWF